MSLTLNSPLCFRRRPIGRLASLGRAFRRTGRTANLRLLGVERWRCKGCVRCRRRKSVGAYWQLKEIRGPVCYIGASAGALNAYVLATANADDLISFWQTADASKHPWSPLSKRDHPRHVACCDKALLHLLQCRAGEIDQRQRLHKDYQESLDHCGNRLHARSPQGILCLQVD